MELFLILVSTFILWQYRDTTDFLIMAYIVIPYSVNFSVTIFVLSKNFLQILLKIIPAILRQTRMFGKPAQSVF